MNNQVSICKYIKRKTISHLNRDQHILRITGELGFVHTRTVTRTNVREKTKFPANLWNLCTQITQIYTNDTCA